MSDLIRILVFGTTGVGKTTICNVLAGENEPANDGLKGVTFDNRQTREFKIDNKKAVLIDTIGLNESSQGTVPSKDALFSLLQLLRSSEKGYNLLIHVLRRGRFTQIDEKNYKLFVEKITQNKIPTIAVWTNCEDDEPMSKWLNKMDNITYIKKLGLKYEELVCVGFSNEEKKQLNERFREAWQESERLIRSSILKKSTEQQIKIFDDKLKFLDVLKRTWNSFVEVINLPNKQRYFLVVNKEFWRIMRELEIKDEDIINLLKPMSMFNYNLVLIRDFLRNFLGVNNSEK